MPTEAPHRGQPGHTNANPTLWDKLDLVPAFVSVGGTALWKVLDGPFRGHSGSDTYKHHIAHGVLRKLNSRLNISQFQYIAPPMRSEYEKWCKANSQSPNIVTLSSGVEAYWLGSPSAQNVVLYFNGGGFALGASMDHFVFWGTDVMAHVNSKTPNTISFLFLSYTLTPHASYPTQPRQAIEGLEYLLEDMKRAPSTISLGGDSSGGNLCLAILSQVLHPTSDLPLLKLDEPLKTILLLSPWVSFRMDFPSCTSNANRDVTEDKAETMWATTYLAGTVSTPYAEPLVAESDWWRGAENAVQHVICTAGTDEIAVDAVKQWADRYKSATPSGHLEYVSGHREVHIAPVIRLLFRDPSPTEQGEAIKAFLLSKL